MVTPHTAEIPAHICMRPECVACKFVPDIIEFNRDAIAQMDRFSAAGRPDIADAYRNAVVNR